MQAAFSAKHSSGFPRIAGTNRKIAEAFGVRRRRGPAKRATFVLGSDGVVLFRIDSEFSMSRQAHEDLGPLRRAAT